MAININADTTNGLVMTSDTSGELKLQSAGADIATVHSSGITMHSGMTLSGNVGKVLQVVHVDSTGYDYNNTMTIGSLLHQGATITPSSASSKILAIATWRGEKVYGSGGSPSPTGYYFGGIYRDTTLLMGCADAVGHQAPSNMRQDHSGTFLDSPSTTSPITYYIKVYNGSNLNLVRFIVYGPRLTLLEIAG